MSADSPPSVTPPALWNRWLQVLVRGVAKSTVEAGPWLLAERGQISSRVGCTGATHQLEICANGGQDS